MLSQDTAAASDALAAPARTSGPARITLPWLTGEVTLYITFGLIALALRVAALDLRPLDTAEAEQALVAWAVASGHVPEVTHAYSPLLFLGNFVAFGLFGASDIWARLVPALFGTALALTPILYRRWLGRWGALASAALLTVSPIGLYYSRYLSSEVVVVTCALLTLAGVAHLSEQYGTHYLNLTVVSLALMLTAGPGTYSILLIFAMFLALQAVSRRLGYSKVEWASLRRAWEAINAQGRLERRLLIPFALILVLVSTAFLSYLPGFQAVTELLPSWLAQIGPVPGGQVWYHHFLLLLFYEPLVLVFGAVGLVLAFGRGGLVTSFLVHWTVLAFYIYTLFGGKSSGDALVSLVPLTLLAGLAIGRLIDWFGREGLWEVEGLSLGIAAPVLIYAILQISSFAQMRQPPYLWLSMVGPILTAGLFVGYWFWSGPQSAVRGLGLTVCVFLTLFVLGTSWRLNFVTAGQPPEVVMSRPTHTDLRALLSTLEQLSAWRAGDRRELPISILGTTDPVLKWYVRDFRTVRYPEAVGAEPETSLYITPDSQPAAPVGEAYWGQRFPLRSEWTLDGLRGADWISWCLYRRVPTRPRTEGVILWARGGGGVGPAGSTSLSATVIDDAE